MTDLFDPYQQWLGISLEELPAHYYRLLGLPPFEPDFQKIAMAAEERMGHVRSFQTGRRGHLTPRILNELASARHCLTNPTTKAAYDAMLRGQLSVSFDNTPTLLPPSANAAAFDTQPPAHAPLAGTSAFVPTQNFGGVAQPYPQPAMFGTAAPTGSLSGYSQPTAMSAPMAVPISRTAVTPPPMPEPPPIAAQPNFEPAPPPILSNIQIDLHSPTVPQKIKPTSPVKAAAPPPAPAPVMPAEDRVAIYARTWFPLAAIGTIILLVAMGLVIRNMLRSRSVPTPPVPDSSTVDQEATSASDESSAAVAEENAVAAQGVVISQEGDGGFNFPASLAIVSGRTANRQIQNDVYVIANWTDQTDTLSWRFQISRPAFFRVILTYSASADAAGGSFGLSLGDVELRGDVRTGATPGQFIQETTHIAVKRNGEHTLTLRPLQKPGTEFMIFKSLRFVPHNAPRENPEEKTER